MAGAGSGCGCRGWPAMPMDPCVCVCVRVCLHDWTLCSLVPHLNGQCQSDNLNKPQGWIGVISLSLSLQSDNIPSHQPGWLE